MDYLISDGLKAADPVFISKQVEFVLSYMGSDGGFAGRIGNSDLYYTDFALRVMSACHWSGDGGRIIGTFVKSREKSISSIVDCFNYLNCIRILEELGAAPLVDADHILGVIDSHRTANNGFSKDQSNHASVYATFLAMLCLEMLGVVDKRSAGLPDSILGVAFADGGFAETKMESGRQTNPTAAALSLLAISANNSTYDLQKHLQYLSNMQRDDGGLSASEYITFGDLLSTFSGVAVMAFLGNLELIDLRKTARFLKTVEHPNGGFRACAADPEADIEYTFYGLGVLGILRSYLLSKG
jgi:geranylgeranyl transferase type-2 subunit beta